MTGPVTVDRRQALSHDDLIREYVTPLKPVILTDAIGHWRALGAWTPEMFKERYGERQVVVDGRSYTMSDLIDRVLASRPEHPAPYLRNSLIADWPESVKADISPMPSCTKPNWLESRLFPSRESFSFVELYIGGTGAGFPVLHYDGLHTHAFLMQIYGRKEFIVYPPDQAPFLYPGVRGGAGNSQVNDVLHPDLTRFPLFARATPTVFTLEAGETLFVPSGWWHTTRMLTPSITVSTNTVNRSNWGAFSTDFLDRARRHRSLAYATLIALYLPILRVIEPLIDVIGDV